MLAPVAADAQQLPLRDGSMDGATVAFGIRNVASLDAALREVHRVLAPGATFVILEFTTPRSRLVRLRVPLYFHRLLPFIGGVVSGHRTAYRYLPQSVAHFPAEPELARAHDAPRDSTTCAGRRCRWGSPRIHSGRRR